MPPFRRPRLLVALAVLLTLGIGALFANAILTLRNEQWAAVRGVNAGLADSLERNIAGTLGAYDLSLQGVIAGLGKPQIMALESVQRHWALFDPALRTQGVASVMVLDARGDVVLDSAEVAPRKHNLADRDFFKLFHQGSYLGLYIGMPTRLWPEGPLVLPLARAYTDTAGEFAGLAVAGLRLDYFRSLFSAFDLGAQSRMTLLRADGTVVVRFPFREEDAGKSIAGSENLQRMLAKTAGDFVSMAALDRVERFFTYRHVGQYPLIVSLGQATETIFAPWRKQARLLGGFAVLLMLATLVLGVLFVRELQKRQGIARQLEQAERDMRTILDNLPSLVSYWDADLRNRFANKAASAAFGLTPEGMQGREAVGLLGASDYAVLEPYVRHALEGEVQVFERAQVDGVTGAVRHNHIVYTPDRPQPGGPVQGIFSQVTDISERKRMEDELFEEKERMRLTLQSIGDAVLCTDAQGLITYINPVAQRMTGWQAFDAAGQSVDEVAPLYHSNGAKVEPSPMRQTLDSGQACGPTRGVVLHRKDGHRYVVEESASPITDRHGQLSGAVMVLHDVTETMALAERMAHLAQYDALTNLPNRVLLQDRARPALAQARRDGKGLAVAYLDLDGFKQVNDTLGHDAGDQLLVQFAQRLSAAVRESDTASRQGGDEFILLLPGLEGEQQAAVVAAKLLTLVQEPFALQGQTVRVGLSAGLALFPQHGASYEELARNADAAMYAAKRGGRMQVRLFVGAGAQPAVLAPQQSGELL